MPTRTDAERIEAVLTGRDSVTGDFCDRLDPAALDGDEWQTVFFACNEAGVPEATVDAWNATDPARYDQRKNATRYRSLDPGKTGNAGMGSFVNVCKAHGVRVPVSGGNREGTCREASGSTTRPQSAPAEERELTPLQMCREQVTALFEPGEFVGIEDASKTLNAQGKYGPCLKPRFIERDELLGMVASAEERGEVALEPLLGRLLNSGDLSGHGVYVYMNPLDGHGRKGENVTAYRHILLEGDDDPIEQQMACLDELGLPYSAVTYSGNKSVHALVRVDAPTVADYKAFFESLAKNCDALAVKADRQNSNVNRLTRLAGAVRDGELQRLESVDPGASWNRYVADTLAEAAREKAEKAKGSTLPMPTDLSDGWGVDRRAPDLIEGMLRCGQLGMMAGPSKAGKSWAAIQLAVAVATGGLWLDRQCKQGRVLYVDYELAPESSDRRVWEVSQAAWGLQHDLDRGGFDALVKANVRPLHLRGTFKPTEQYAAHIKAVCEATGAYDLIIVDPFYRFSDADENSAKETGGVMAMGYGIVDATGAAVMIVHHYPKGKPGLKDAIDRMSGSGVLTRSPDCLLDFAPLDDDVGDPDLAVVLNGKVAVEVTPTVRDHPPVKPFRVIRDHPLMLPTDNEAVAKLDVKGANRPAENKRKAARAKAREHDRCDKCLMDSWERSNEHHFTYGGVEYAPWPRMRDVLDKDPETGIAGSVPTINSRLKESSLFGCTTPRALGMDRDEYKDLGLTWCETLAYVLEAEDHQAPDHQAPDDSTGTC